MSIEATDRIRATARESRIPEEIPALFEQFCLRAKAAGYQNEEAAALIKLLRTPKPAAAPR